MIITLMGADFSASNIGTLSSWRITRSLGAGATYEGVSSVDKGASFNATVTIAEGYELGSAGVTITMGGNPVSVATVNGNTITISIAEVTGNVVIKVPTVNLSTGEEEEPDEPVLLTNYTLDVINIPKGTQYTVSEPYTSSIFKITTDRWLNGAANQSTKAGCYELTSFPYNNTEYLLARIDVSPFKAKGYKTIKINVGTNPVPTGTSAMYWTYASNQDANWTSDIPRENMPSTYSIDISDKTILYFGIRRYKTDGSSLTHYLGESFEVVFS